MPRRKSQSATGEKPVTSVSSDTINTTNVATDELLKLVAQMQQEIGSLKEQLNNKSENSLPSYNVSKAEDQDEFDVNYIKQDDYVKVISLCDHPLYLSTEPKGRGRHYVFPDFGSQKRIIYSDLNKLMDNHQNFLEQGKFFIADKRVIRRHGLDDTYSKILSKEIIERIVGGDISSNDAVSLYKSSSLAQQTIIRDMIIKKLIDGEQLDLNMVDKISKAYDPENSIDSAVREAKKFLEILNQK